MNSEKKNSSSTKSPKRDSERNEVETFSISLTSGDSDNTSEHNVGVTVTSSPGRQPRLEVSVEVSTRSRVFQRPGSQQARVGHGASNISAPASSSTTKAGLSNGASAALKHVPVVSSSNNGVPGAGWSASSSASNSSPCNSASAAVASNKIQAAGSSVAPDSNSGPANGACAALRQFPVSSGCSGLRVTRMTSSGACNIPGPPSNTGARPKTSRRQTTNKGPTSSSPNALGNGQPGQCDQRPRLIPQYPPHDLRHVKAKVNTGIGAQSCGQARNRGNSNVTRNVSSHPPVARSSSVPVSRIPRAQETTTRQAVVELPLIERNETTVGVNQRFQNRDGAATTSTERATTASGLSNRAAETRAAARSRSESYFINFNDQLQEGGAVGGVAPLGESPIRILQTAAGPISSSTVADRDEERWQSTENLYRPTYFPDFDLSILETDEDIWPSYDESFGRRRYRHRVVQSPVRLTSRHASAVSPDEVDRSILRDQARNAAREHRDQLRLHIATLSITSPHSRRNNPPFYSRITSTPNARENGNTNDFSGLRLFKSDVNSLENTVLFTYQGWMEDECSICLDSLRRCESVRRLPCMHLFHALCIEAWLRIRGVCPNCLFKF